MVFIVIHRKHLKCKVGWIMQTHIIPYYSHHLHVNYADVSAQYSDRMPYVTKIIYEPIKHQLPKKLNTYQ